MLVVFAMMRLVSDLITKGFANFPRPAVFRRDPMPHTMRAQVDRIFQILVGWGVKVLLRVDGQEHADGTFVYDHAFLVWIQGRLYAFLPCGSWPRHEEMPIDLPFLQLHAELVNPPETYRGKKLKFDPGTVVGANGVILIGYSRSKNGRTNWRGAKWLEEALRNLGYDGKIVLVQHIGLHLSTFCTCISTSEKPELVFLVAPRYVKDVAAIRKVAQVIEVHADEAWRANAIAHHAMRGIILMKRWIHSEEDLLLKTLLDRGYTVEVVELTESPCVQGSLFCHVLMFMAKAELAAVSLESHE